MVEPADKQLNATAEDARERSGQRKYTNTEDLSVIFSGTQNPSMPVNISRPPRPLSTNRTAGVSSRADNIGMWSSEGADLPRMLKRYTALLRQMMGVARRMMVKASRSRTGNIPS